VRLRRVRLLLAGERRGGSRDEGQGVVKVTSFWLLGDIYESVTIEAPEGSGAISITASVGPGANGGWCAEWWRTTPSFDDVEKHERVYRNRNAANARAVSALQDELRELSRPLLARAS
jgi:hypothetical protein